ncbi:MAG: hypothetical protein IT383_12150 [Deltaproteobacteria bacterium]|nr:hypothetical protein [Deltaproteobacteria bacterium]
MLIAALALAAATPQPLPPMERLPLHVREALERAERPVATYVPAEAPSRMYAAGAPLVIYLNRWGGSYRCGDDNSSINSSSIACGLAANADVGPFSLGDDAWTEVRDCVAELFAPFSMHVTDLEPLAGDYIEAVVGGSPEQAGMSASVGGVAPYSCDVIPQAIVYAFADVYGNDPRGICETAAQEIAHAFGLDHEYLCADPMTYLLGCGDKAFVDEYVPCGEYEPRECTCGEPTQNSVQSMLTLFGASDGTQIEPLVDLAPPAVELLAPLEGAILTANTELVISAVASDDVGLTVVELQWDFTGEAFFCPSVDDSYECTREGTSYTWKLDAGLGGRSFRVHVRDVAGNEATSDDVSVWLSNDGSGPPDDRVPPMVIVGSPLDGATAVAGEPIPIIVTAADDHGLASVMLLWEGPFGVREVPCPYEDDRSSCTVEGKTYTWVMSSRREGERSFSVRAVDVVGNVTESPQATIELLEAAELPADDGDDSFDRARSLGCGESLELVNHDADFFVVVAPAGTDVELSVEGGDGARVLAFDANAAILEEGKRAVGSVATDAPMTFAVVPERQSDAAYTVSVVCTAPTPPATSCVSCSAGAGAAPLALLALLRLRQRR